MVIYRRKIQTQKSQEDVLQIMQSSAHHGNCKITASSFSIKCSKRNQKGQMMFVPVKGQVVGSDGATEVTLELHAGVEVMIGLAILAIELITMLLQFIFPIAGKTAYSGILVGFGAVISIFYGFRGIEVIDLLEHKLTR
jgi:hypothetical protein